MTRYHFFKTEAEAMAFDQFCKAVGALSYYVGRNGDEYEVREIV